MIWSIIKNVQYFLKKARDDHINAFAAQTAFFIILSFIPFMMVFSSMLRYTPITEAMLLERDHTNHAGLYRSAYPDGGR